MPLHPAHSPLPSTWRTDCLLLRPLRTTDVALDYDAGRDLPTVLQFAVITYLVKHGFNHILYVVGSQVVLTPDLHFGNNVQIVVLSMATYKSPFLHGTLPAIPQRIASQSPRTGRYNGVYDAPRRVLQALGLEVVEMPRSRDRSYCCGAGGGRIWMEDTEKVQERPVENRIREAVALPGVQTFVVACPKDIAMFREAVKTTGHEEQLAVKDLAELVAEAMTDESPKPA